MMDFIDNLKEETLIICNNSFKEKILKLHKLIPIKFMTMKEFISKYYFTYDDRAILYLINNYHIRYEVAKLYLDNLYCIKDKKYNIKKLDFLVDLKKELDKENLLIYNDNFKKYLKKIKIIIYDYNLNNFQKEMFNDLDYKIIKREYKNYEHKIYSFDNIDNEVEYVAYQICSLIDSGIDIKKIKLTNINEDYYNVIERIFSLFNLKVNIPYQSKLSSYKIISKFISLYKDNNYSLEECLDKIDKEDIMYSELIKIINKYYKYLDRDYLIYMLENSYIFSKKYDNGIEIVNYLEYIPEDSEYIFMLGFNDGVVPNSYKDIDYITDNICSLVGLDTSVVKNTYLRKEIINKLKDIKNLVITYKNKDNKKSYYPSTLCNEFEVIKGNINYLDSYSEVYNKIKLMREYDNYIRYGYTSSNFDLLNNNFKINYNSYSNKYTKINRIMKGLRLSYTSMQLYNKCAFRYYLAKILKLDIFEENFSTVIGSMVHYVMEMCLSNNDMDTDKYVNIFLKNKEFSKKEWFFLDKYKVMIKELLDQVILEREYSLFNQALYEKEIMIDYGNNVKFVGIIDKVLYYIDNNQTYIALIDYKTGNDNISLKYLKYGLDIQLPIYLYLSKRMEFSNPKYVGLYLQKFNIKDRDYRLLGYSNSDKDTLKIIDNNYDNSKIIKGMRTLKDGSFSRYTKVLSDDEINKIDGIVEDKILEVIDNIKNNEFPINPKVIDGENRGCEYCKFIDICNMVKSDKVEITTDSEEE
ncbi:MAG: PD-(D/E)XK nuclease family protein [Bacilli bacterium]|nr:PD-(D/E)XK nuclease family protein [Bacilli bacterium]